MKQMAFQVLSVSVGSMRNLFLSGNPKDLFNFPRPSLPTVAHLSSLQTGDAMGNREAVAGR